MIKLSRKIKTIIAIIIIVIVAYFIISTLSHNWNELRQYPLSFNVGYILIFLVLISLFYFLAPMIWGLSLRLLGQKMKFRKILKVWHSAQLVRYIPGNVAFVLGRTEVGKKEGIPREKNLIATSLELGLVVIACLTIFLFYIIASAENISWLLFVLIPVGLILLHPKIFIPIINWLLKIVKRPRIEYRIKYKQILVLFIIVLFIQLFEGIAYAFLLKSVFNYDLTFWSLLRFAAIYEGAWVIGFLSFFTPSGIGVREAALILLLEKYTPITAAIIFSIFARICAIIVEVIFALSVLGVNKLKDKKKRIIIHK
jgi:uncharacterized membrane protein YbhN (UPF0104 family)